MSFLFAATVVALLTFYVANAGFFSFLGTGVSAQESPRTYLASSNSLLAAAINPEPNLSDDVVGVIIDDDALQPPISPDNWNESEESRSSDQIARYFVRKGDTLSSIAKMFGVSVNTIRWSNDLTSGTIRVGQELVILPIDGVRYTVKRGDTLSSIAKKFKGDTEEIMNFNDLASNEHLLPGTEIVIPDGVVVSVPIIPRANSRSNVARYTGPEIVGYFARPLSSSCSRTQGLHGNNGIDLGCPTGTTIMAAAGGEVLIARDSGWNGGYGQMVVVAHDNSTQTLYGHMSAVSVSSGERVVQGQKLGEVGRTGKSTGPHLHFEIRGAKNPF